MSNTLSTDFCLETLREALAFYGLPEIFNTDQGAQFTAAEFISELTKYHISISMDGRGRCLDNIFVERLWRSVKHEDVYLNGYQTIPECRRGLTTYFQRYNKERPHQSLGYKTPWQIYTGQQRTCGSQEAPRPVAKFGIFEKKALVVEAQEALFH